MGLAAALAQQLAPALCTRTRMCMRMHMRMCAAPQPASMPASESASESAGFNLTHLFRSSILSGRIPVFSSLSPNTKCSTPFTLIVNPSKNSSRSDGTDTRRQIASYILKCMI